MKRLLITALAAIALLACAAPTAHASTGWYPQPAVHHFDAHDGQIVQVGATYYEYGTSYACGFAWLIPGTTYCGVHIYTSPDLAHWTNRGLAFDASTSEWQTRCAPGGCFEPRVLYDRGLRRYVMWINNANDSDYAVLSAPTPLGPWTYLHEVTAAQPSGSEALFRDANGQAFLVRTDLVGKVVSTRSHELVIDYIGVAGYTSIGSEVLRVPYVGWVEAPNLFRRNGIYYLTFSSACPYCTASVTYAMQSRSLFGGWSKPYAISARSCGGQQAAVSVLTFGTQIVALYQSDLWVRNPGDTITRNQSGARQAWVPMSFDAAAHIRPLVCPVGTG